MMRSVVKCVIIGLVILGIACMAQTTYAQDMGRKLYRGLGNILTGWIEIPKNIYDESVESNVLVGLTVGTVRGAGLAALRTVVGGYETVTFFIPVPKDYEPIIQPEFVVGGE